jgi:DNA end-binding protein Ku
MQLGDKRMGVIVYGFLEVNMRSIWSGAISFGLIYIPVKLYSASQNINLDFDLLRRGDHCKIGYSKVCKETGEEVPNDEIVRGFEYRKGRLHHRRR